MAQPVAGEIPLARVAGMSDMGFAAGIVLILLAIPIIVLLRAIGVRGQSLPDPAGRRDPD